MSPIAQALAGQHLLVTGTTGFVGKVWLSLVLTHAPDVGRITLLLRGGRAGSAHDRMVEILDRSPALRPLREQHGRDLGPWLAERLEILDADITRPDLGLSAPTREALARSVDAVVHIAGLTDFHPDPAKGVPANVDGAVHVARLARTLRVPRLLHMSTAYVAGTADGPTPERLTPGVAPSGARFDPEAVWREVTRLHTTLPDAAARTEAVAEVARTLGWPNNYTFTKGLAEHLLAGMDLDLAIVRPSVVECARTFPLPGWNEGLNTSGPIMWYCGTGFRALPTQADHTFDIVPVDAVARWTTLALAALLQGRHEPVYHLASGDVNPATFARIVELTALGRRRHAREVDATWTDRVASWIDVTPSAWDAQPTLRPERVATWADRLDRRLRRLAGDDGLLAGPAQRLRRHVTRTRRDMGRLHRMLEVYRPFIHDHSWTFATDHIRALASALPASDPFHDEVETLCWRRYWLDVQYPGIVRWAFPILRGETVPCDPPSRPPLILAPTESIRGVA